MNDISKNIEKYNPNKKQKILMVFKMIANILSNKKLNVIVTELFIWGRKLNISLVFITQSYLAISKNIRQNSTHYFVMKIPNKTERQQIAFNHSSDIDFKDFMNLYRKCIAKQYSYLVIDAILASDNPLSFRKNLSKIILKLIMTIDDNLRDEKMQYDINRKAEKISALSSAKIDKYEYITVEEIFSIRKSFWKTNKNAEEQGENQMKTIED